MESSANADRSWRTRAEATGVATLGVTLPADVTTFGLVAQPNVTSDASKATQVSRALRCEAFVIGELDGAEWTIGDAGVKTAADSRAA
jgi:hypothetical protein